MGVEGSRLKDRLSSSQPQKFGGRNFEGQEKIVVSAWDRSGIQDVAGGIAVGRSGRITPGGFWKLASELQVWLQSAELRGHVLLWLLVWESR